MRALISVSDKTGVVELARGLSELGAELVSTGGTAAALRDAGLAVTDVAEVTGAPEMLGGRVKTLHPRIAAGVLADRHDPDHVRQLAEAGIEAFELVIVNLYRFEAAAARGVDDEALIEEIDIGGPTLVRAAAKNHGSVAILTDPADYPVVLAELREHGAVTAATRRRLALAAYRLTAAYDAAIAFELGARWAVDEPFPERLTVGLRLGERLRYGENPHQGAALYVRAGARPEDGPLATGGTLLAGKPLSYNNLLDASAAAAIARDLDGHAVVVVKHTNPCGVAVASDLVTAWERALAADPVSAFGGVVAIRGPVDGALARGLASLFLEVVVAEAFTSEALAALSTKRDLRLLVDSAIIAPPVPAVALRSAGGAVLVSEADTLPDDPATWRVATRRAPDERESGDLDLAWRVVKHVSSNAIVLARDGVVVGVGAGQMSRVESARLAVGRAGDRAQGAACASDAFYPFPDGVEVCLAAGVSAFAQPGGSKRDDEVVAAVDAAGGAMVLTGRRHFRH
jgi:phosphoribosylaminoimidazolecarboxamide formyltransferase/IMP cyclohydrolase